MEHIQLDKEIAVEKINYKNPYDFAKLHRHSYYEFILFEIGTGGKQVIDFLEYENSSRSLFIIVPGQVHLLNRMVEENGILIQFSKAAFNQAVSPIKVDCFFNLILNTKIQLDKEKFNAVLYLFKKIEEVYESDSTLKRHKLFKLLGYLLIEIIEIIAQRKEISHIDNVAYKFLDAVHDNVKSIKSVQGYAKLLNVSTIVLVRKVSKHLGQTPLQVIHEVLLLEIKRLLMVEQLSHKEIAYVLNFDSQSSYSRFVKTHTSLSPSLLKKQLSQIAQ